VSLPDGGIRRRGLLLVAAAATCWSTGGLIARLVDPDPWTTIFWRGTFCALFLLGVLAVTDRGRLRELFRRMGWPGIAMALCFATASTCFIVALERTSVANTLIIQSTGPFAAGLLGWLWMGERVRAHGWLAMTAALGGSAIMVSGSFASGTIEGDLLAFVIALAFATATVVVRRHRDIRMAPAACLAAVFAALFALPSATPLEVSAGDLGLLALFGAGQLGIGLILFTAGAQLIPAAEASLVAVLESILGPVWVWVLLGESPGVRSLIGGAIVLSALAAHTALELREERSAPPAA
jgi:drug/metabolite transporter (DMT)-like permease